MYGLVLCAGFGTRLRPLTNVIPKPAVPVGALPAALRNVEQLLDAGFGQIHCNTHYLADELERQMLAAAHSRGWPAEKIRFWSEPEILETGGGIARIVKACAAEQGHTQLWDTLVVSGDIVADIPLQSMLDAWAQRSSNDAALMASLGLKTPRKDVTWVDTTMRYVVGFGSDSTAEDAATRGWQPRVFSNHQILGSRILERSSVEKLSSIDLFYRQALRRGEKILNISLDDSAVWFDIGTPESYFDCISKLNLHNGSATDWSESIIQICAEVIELNDQTDHTRISSPHHDYAKPISESHAQPCLSDAATGIWEWLGQLYLFPESLLQGFEVLLSRLEKKEGPVGQTSGLCLTSQSGAFLSRGIPPQVPPSLPLSSRSSLARRGFIDVPLPLHLGAHPLCRTPLLIPLHLLLEPLAHSLPVSAHAFWLLINPRKQ